MSELGRIIQKADLVEAAGPTNTNTTYNAVKEFILM